MFHNFQGDVVSATLYLIVLVSDTRHIHGTQGPVMSGTGESDISEKAKTTEEVAEASGVKEKECSESVEIGPRKSENVVIFKLRDRSKEMVEAWKESFNKHQDNVQVSHGDIFCKAPAADALVSPANSFGFMDGGIDMAYSIHFGWQLQERLQEIIRTEKHGELLVGDVIILPTFEGGATKESMDWSESNEGQPIKWLISAPTMRLPMNVDHTVNAYLAFKAVVLAVQDHNRDESKEKITSVLVPGLGTAIGRMPASVCAYQMLQAYETFELGLHPSRIAPSELYEVSNDHAIMANLLED